MSKEFDDIANFILEELREKGVSEKIVAVTFVTLIAKLHQMDEDIKALHARCDRLITLLEQKL